MTNRNVVPKDHLFRSGGCEIRAPRFSISDRWKYFHNLIVLLLLGALSALHMGTAHALMLVHETATADGKPNGLELAYATPRGWLAAGKRIAVADAPTD